MIPDELATEVKEAYQAMGVAIDDQILAISRDLADGADELDLFFEVTNALYGAFVKSVGDELPRMAKHGIESFAQLIAASGIRLAKPATEPAAAPARTILEPGQEHRVGFMYETGRLVEVVLTRELDDHKVPQLVMTLKDDEQHQVAIRTVEPGKWSPL